MSSIVVAGDTSGSVTLSAPSVAGSTVLTLPAVSGTLVSTGNAVSFSSVTTPIINSATTLSLQTNSSTTAVTIDASQNVGIGYTSPYGKLSINAGNYAPASSGNMANGFTVSNNTTGVAINIGTNDTGGYNFIQSAYVNSAGSAVPLALFTGATERMRIDSSGSLAIGTSSALGKMSLYWNNLAQQGFTLQASTTTFNGSPIVFYNSSGSLSGFVGQTATTISYNTSSDYRLKDNIAPMTGALDIVSQLKPVTYNWISDKSKGQGFIAHELQAVVPDCVTGEKDAVNEDGTIKPQGIDTSFLVATLTSAIQEQQALITTLQTQITALNAKVGI